MTHTDVGMDAETFNMLLASVNKWGRSQQDREELFTLCVENYYLKLPGKEVIGEKRKSYLSVLFRNSCIDFLRKNRSRLRYEILLSDMKDEWEELSLKTENPHEESLHIMVAENFLKSLNDVDRTFAIGLLDDVSYQELSDTLKLPLNTIKTRVHRLRKHWKQIPQLMDIGA